jgi:hypothetical protein
LPLPVPPLPVLMGLDLAVTRVSQLKPGPSGDHQLGRWLALISSSVGTASMALSPESTGSKLARNVES